MKRLVVSVAALAIFAIAAMGHHSLSATYQADKTITLDGKILNLELKNPHSYLHLEAPDDKGVMQRWSLEWRSAGSLGQQNIKRDTLKAGDEVVVTLNPSRTVDDRRGALLTLHRKSDGFGWGTRPGETPE